MLMIRTNIDLEVFRRTGVEDNTVCISKRSNLRPYLQVDSLLNYELLLTSELDALTAIHLPNDLNYYETFDLTLCNCSLCIVRNNALQSCVSKAKRLIDEAVLISSAPTNNVGHMIKNKDKLHLIDLLHSFFFVVCL